MATKPEFASVLAYLATATGCPKPPKERAEVYFDLLGDLPCEVLMAAARMTALDHKYPTLPPAGLIRSNALALASPDKAPAAPEAWELALTAVRKYGLEARERYVAGGGKVVVGGRDAALAELPERVARAVRAFGWERLCNARPENQGVDYAHFVKCYDTLGADADRAAIMPPSVKALAEGIGRNIDTMNGKALPQKG